MAPASLTAVVAAAEAHSLQAGSLAGHGYKLADLRLTHLKDEVTKLLRSRPKTASGSQARAFAQFVLAEQALRDAFPLEPGASVTPPQVPASRLSRMPLLPIVPYVPPMGLPSRVPWVQVPHVT